jgi:hypothetical protein
VKDAKLPHFRVHDLRHSYASALIQNGESLAYVRDQLGHASIQITVDTYGHLVPGGNRAAVDRLDDAPGSRVVATAGDAPTQVDATKPRAGRDVWLFDTEVPGFALRIDPSARRTFVLFYRASSGRQRRVTIGQVGGLTAEQARDKARALRQHVRDGGDPVAERKAARSAETVDKFCDRYLTAHAELHKKPSSVKDDRGLMRRYIRPDLGALTVTEVTREHVTRLHQRLRDTPYVANRCLALLAHDEPC